VRRLLWVVLVLMASLGGGPALAAGCFAVADVQPRLLPVAIPAGSSVGITFLGHASFLLETAGGATVVTDYNGYIKAPVTPEIVTMNNAHDTHFTDSVEDGVQHVLRGWNPAGGEAHHDLTHRDLRIRNVPTSVHGRSGDQGNSNSIFVFELADLCVAHLGHLHHVLTEQHLAELGQIDVVMVPVDGAWTMSQREMVLVIEQIGPSLVLPMHYFGSSRLGRFLDLVDERWEVVMSAEPSVALSRASLPRRRILVLPGT
jgi:L-ascorbate metabolism protein UlaG (beta-lactamase superfamily)